MVGGVEKPKEDRGRPAAASRGGERTRRVVTVPNLLCVVRMLGSLALVALAVMGRGEIFLWLFVALALTDWLDGKLALLLEQKSVLGARLDSWADATLYAALLFGAFWLHGATLRAELGWIVTAVASYAVSTLAGFWKYGRWPSYHTRAAKTSWFLIAVGVVCFFAEWAVWPLRLALAAVTLTNLEAGTITLLSDSWRANVESVFHVLRERRRQ
jgi:cardiolipin synthase